MTETTDNLRSNPAFLDGKPKRMLIDGQWAEAVTGKTFSSLNPSTGTPLASIAEGEAEDVDRAVSAARRAFEGTWGKVKAQERQRLLLTIADVVDAHFDELALLDTLDMGSPIRSTSGNRLRIVSMIRYYAGLATTIRGETIENSLPGDVVTYTLKEPVGVVGAIIPWNAPLFMCIWKICPALATGCTLVLKPASEASLATLRLGELLMEAGVPAGVVNIVTGPGATVGAALASHPDVDKISFTGSHETGQEIVRASAGNLKRLSLELGGKSPDIVFADANLDAAVPMAAMAVFNNTGQMCIAGSRLFVERSIYGEFVDRVVAFAQRLKIGNSLDAATMIGPLISERQLKRVIGYMDIGKGEGARLVTGGQRVTDGDLSAGYFVPPTVFADVQDDMRIAKEEIFGPVMAAIPFDEVDDVIRRANATPFGLAGGVWTSDIGKAHRVAKGLRTGTVWVNSYLLLDPAVPYGGYKMSGYGRESGVQHLEEFLNTKAVWIKTA